MRDRLPRRLLLLAIALGTLSAAACGVKAPLLALDGVHVGRPGLTHLPMDVTFRVRNPNPEPLAVDRFDFELLLNGRRIGRGFEPKGLELQGFGEGRVKARLEVSLLSLPGAVREMIEDDHAHARVKGRFYTTGPSGTKRLRFNSDAEVDLGRRD